METPAPTPLLVAGNDNLPRPPVLVAARLLPIVGRLVDGELVILDRPLPDLP